ncbi:hypothetical protein P7K49_036336 [Saguinus oedipus]|uniref:Uncharacterized protein n=1 Tax=Saguinus oedipus TaxID=9490 RepID=A0ABQ9TJW1_SAGOE|nr:hypothetical protein P7K49_036336 [Saguinus oedipus]
MWVGGIWEELVGDVLRDTLSEEEDDDFRLEAAEAKLLWFEPNGHLDLSVWSSKTP